jgi:hypothetical protein
MMEMLRFFFAALAFVIFFACTSFFFAHLLFSVVPQ